MAKNGYFRIKITDSGRFVEIIPPEEGGEVLEVNELRDYLSDRGYPVDLVKLKSTIDSAKDDVKVAKIDSAKGFPEAESYRLDVSKDGMVAKARFYAPSDGGNELSKEEILNDLKVKEIVFGIDEAAIEEFLNTRDYCRTFTVATGKEVKEGVNGSIEYFFNTVPDKKPKLNKDGTVDFFNLDIISSCSEGDVLARIIPPEEGEDGKDIYGSFITPKELVRPVFKVGNNTEVSEDGLELRSCVDGNVSLLEGMVFVREVYEIKDVDTSTGNIDYKGDVKILGSVRDGFSVKARGSVEVKGVVEGAKIEAGEDIIIGRGMNGMGRGELKAGRNVIAKFFENTRVDAGGYIQAEAIIHSEVISKTDVIVNGKKGNISGGLVRAKGYVEAKSVGSEMGIETHIEVGNDPELKAKLITLEEDIAKLSKAVEQLSPVIAAYTAKLKKGEKLSEEQLTQMKQINTKYKALSGALEKENKIHEACIEELRSNEGEKGSVVKVSGEVFPGTVITIQSATKEIKSSTQHSRFVREGVDVRIKALY